MLRKHALSNFCYSGKFCFILFFLSSGIFSDIFSVELRYVCTFLSLSVFFICCAIIIRNFCIVSVRTRFFADISLAVQISLTLTHTTHYAGIGHRQDIIFDKIFMEHLVEHLELEIYVEIVMNKWNK